MNLVKLEKLNGWQRIWFLLQIVTVIAFIYYGYINFPTYEKINEMGELRHSAKSAADLVYLDISKKDFAPCENLRYGNHNEFMKCLGENASMRYWKTEEHKASLIEEEENSKHVEMTQALFQIKIFLMWIGSGVVSYITGLAVAWVIRGFK